jgi:hypothetical protein
MSKIGEKHITNEGYEITIIEYHNIINCTVQFENGVVIKRKQYIDIKRGNIKNPYHPSVYGIAFVGQGEYSQKKNKNASNIWRGMFHRCYDLKYHSYLSYKDVTVCEEWHNFQNFAEWFENNYKENFELDKDILQKGNKIYSPETCCFVPQEVNKLLTKSNKARGECPIGVTKRGNMFRAKLNIKKTLKHLGSFKTIDEAFKAYKVAKEDYIKEVADKWRGQIADQAYQALINYKIEITD